MQSLSLWTAILNKSSLKIAVGEMHSHVARPKGTNKLEKCRTLIEMPDAIEPPRGSPEGILRFLEQCAIWQPCTFHYTQYVTRPPY